MSAHHHPLERIGLRAAAEQDRLLADTDGGAPDTDVLLAGVHSRQKKARVRRVALGGAAFSLVLLLVVLFGGRLRPKVAPTAPSTLALGPRSAVTSDLPLAFPDRSQVIVKPGTVADVRELRHHGAVIALDHGTVDVHVIHAEDTRWDVVAGPFDVHVTGTRFDATWDPTTKALTVAMKEGSVQVEGPCVNERLAAPSAKTFVCDALAPKPSEPSLPPMPSEAASGSTAIAPAASIAKQDDSPRAMLARADDARLAGDSARAQKLYLAVRERHPKSPEAAKAAFLLGRLSETAGSLDEATRYYALVTQGAYAQDALGRSLELAQRRNDHATARRLADEYMKKYPNGPHKAYATSVLESAP